MSSEIFENPESRENKTAEVDEVIWQSFLNLPVQEKAMIDLVELDRLELARLSEWLKIPVKNLGTVLLLGEINMRQKVLNVGRERGVELCGEDDVMPLLLEIADAKEEEALNSPVIVQGFENIRQKITRADSRWDGERS